LRCLRTLPYPAVQDGMFLITFAEASDFEGKLGPEMYIAKAGEPLEVTGAAGGAQDQSLGNIFFSSCVLPGNRCSTSGSFRFTSWRTRPNAFTFPKTGCRTTRFSSPAWTANDLSRDGRIQHADESHDRREREAATGIMPCRHARRFIPRLPIFSNRTSSLRATARRFGRARRSWPPPGAASANPGGTMNGATGRLPPPPICATARTKSP
jgi:hypothetical protein